VSRELQVRTTLQNGAAVVAPAGEIDLSCSPELRVALQAALKNAPSALVVDLSEVPSIDSSGLATLIEAMRETQAKKIPLILCGVEGRVRAVLEIARLDSVFVIEPDAESALAGLTG